MLAAVIMILLAILVDSWLVAAAVTLGGYIAWLYHRLLKLEEGTYTLKAYVRTGWSASSSASFTNRKKRTTGVSVEPSAYCADSIRISPRCPTPRCF